MAKKRTYNKKQTGKKTAAKRNTKNQATRLDLAIVVLFVLSILSAVLIYGKSGVIGIKLTEILGGLIGIIRYILPIGIFAVAIKIVCEDREELWYKLGQYTIFLITIATVMSTFQITSGELLPNKELTDVIKDAYSIGTSGVGGGAIGAAIAVPLSNLLGNVGALIFSVGAAILMVVFMFGIHTSDILQQGIEKSQQRKEERREARLRCFPATREFELLTDRKYLTSDAYLRRGDILVSSGHTVIVLENGEKEDDMDKGTFTVRYREMRKDLQDNDCSDWSEAARQWAVNNGIVQGGAPLPDGSANFMWQDMMTREQLGRTPQKEGRSLVRLLARG